ncbi:Hsp20/alpha crystallin family protein [Camelliibacillus cellulosilyticus]|uniref:Hsp20/alpha crystallin family protein n=1 Tax=Camelliibacillus cellulosilyticus TaxID=2174486 RepID=A0ABV9GP79_9BACL
MDPNQRKKYQEWKQSVSGFLGKDFWNDFQDFFLKDWPLVNLYESDDHILCLVALPGIRSIDDIHIYINHTSLDLKGHIHYHYNGFHPVREELNKGRFERTVDLPVPVHNEPVDATFKKGMMTIKLKKMKHHQVSEIIVNEED